MTEQSACLAVGMLPKPSSKLPSNGSKVPGGGIAEVGLRVCFCAHVNCENSRPLPPSFPQRRPPGWFVLDVPAEDSGQVFRYTAHPPHPPPPKRQQNPASRGFLEKGVSTSNRRLRNTDLRPSFLQKLPRVLPGFFPSRGPPRAEGT